MLWITGDQGLLGSALKEEGGQWIGTGREVDISKRSQVDELLDTHPEVALIVNCAAFSHVDHAETQREEAYQTNAIGPDVLGEAAQKRGIPFIHISTDYVFPGSGKVPLKETDPVGPTGYYGYSKLEGEKRALDRGACVIRTSWMFGKGGKNFVSRLLFWLQQEKEIRLTDDQWGRFTYASDLAKAILQLSGERGLYHFANQGVATKYEFALAMREEAMRLRYPVAAQSILPVPGAAFHSPCQRPAYSALDTAKIEQILPIRHWHDALKEYLCAQQIAFL